MSVRRACLAAVPLTVAGALALPAAAGGPASTQAPAAVRAALDRVVADGGTVLRRGADGRATRPAELRDALTAPTGGGFDARLRSVATALGAASGTPVLVLPTEQEEVVVPVTVGPDAFAVPAGDLDGDGADDVLAYRSDGGGLALEARRGADGALLWTRPLTADAGFAFPLGADATGDGVDDLALDRFVFVGGLRTSPTGYEYSATLDQTLGVVSGADGADQWSTTVRGTIEEAGTGADALVAGAGRYTVEAHDLLLPMLSPDLHGDGLVDLLVNSVDIKAGGDGAYAGAEVAEAFRYSWRFRSATAASIVDGRTGAGEVVRDSADLPGLSLAFPVGDLDHDAAAEITWTTERFPDEEGTCLFTPAYGTCAGGTDGEYGSTVELVAGGSGATRWSVDDPSSFVFPLPLGDADGDGVDDLVLHTEEGLTVLSGRSGAALWRLGTGEELSTVLGVDDGVAVVLGLTLDDELVVERRAAATGAVLSRERRPVPLAEAPESNADGYEVYAQVLGDGDGDGRSELLLGSLAYALLIDEEEGSATVVAERSAAAVEPFAGGPPLLSTAGDDVRLLFGSDDLDGDALVEAELLVPARDDSGTVSATALRLRDTAALWTATTSWWELPFAAGDQDGRPGSELVAVQRREGGSVVQSLRGADRGCRWAAAAAPAAPAGC